MKLIKKKLIAWRSSIAGQLSGMGSNGVFTPSFARHSSGLAGMNPTNWMARSELSKTQKDTPRA